MSFPSTYSGQKNFRTPEDSYDHTQPGNALFALISIGCLVIAAIIAVGGIGAAAVYIGLLIALLFLLLFAWLKAKVNDGILSFVFSVGIIRRTVRISEIRTCAVVKAPWYYGVGIHIMPNGWLYNVSGASAVEVTIRNVKSFSLGSDEPEKLCQAILVAMSQ